MSHLQISPAKAEAFRQKQLAFERARDDLALLFSYAVAGELPEGTEAHYGGVTMTSNGPQLVVLVPEGE